MSVINEFVVALKEHLGHKPGLHNINPEILTERHHGTTESGFSETDEIDLDKLFAEIDKFSAQFEQQITVEGHVKGGLRHTVAKDGRVHNGECDCSLDDSVEADEHHATCRGWEK